MSGRDSFRLYPETRFAAGDGKRAVSARHTPRQNRLLAALPLEHYERLLPDLEPVALPLGWTIHRPGERQKYLYFLTAGIVSRFCIMVNGASAEFAVTGREGVIGVASFLGGESTPSQAVVLGAGYGYRLEVDLVNREFEHDGPLSHLLLRYTQALIAQTGQIVMCYRHHSLEQQLCRWILACLDRLPSNELALTQRRIADMLGVRREAVTQAAGRLKKAGLIHHHRGHIIVLGRVGLEAHACECYSVIKQAYDEMLREEDHAGKVRVHGARRPHPTGCEESAHAW
jgi:CRP-like cAMP-binding protein